MQDVQQQISQKLPLVARRAGPALDAVAVSRLRIARGAALWHAQTIRRRVAASVQSAAAAARRTGQQV
jgi:hypothetical protein